MKNVMLVAVAGAFLIGCGGGKKSYVQKGELGRSIEYNSVQKQYFEVVGLGAADSSLTNSMQRRATACNASEVQAQYKMLAMLKGLDLEGGIRVEKAMETDSVLQTNINATIKGGEIVKQEWTNDDGCVTTYRLDRKRAEEMMGVKFK